MIGETINSWTILEEFYTKNKPKTYKVICKCGKNSIKRKEYIYKYKQCPDCSRKERSGEKDLIGKKIGSLFIIKNAGILKNHTHYECICDCGRISNIRVDLLKKGKLKNCVQCRTKTHGKSTSSIYRTWVQMIQRCHNPKNKGFHNYGGRGINVCQRWKDSFENFYSDMGDRPKGLEIDRINNNGNYEPSNCRWATRKENSNNKKR